MSTTSAEDFAVLSLLHDTIKNIDNLLSNKSIDNKLDQVISIIKNNINEKKFDKNIENVIVEEIRLILLKKYEDVHNNILSVLNAKSELIVSTASSDQFCKDIPNFNYDINNFNFGGDLFGGNGTKSKNHTN